MIPTKLVEAVLGVVEFIFGLLPTVTLPAWLEPDDGLCVASGGAGGDRSASCYINDLLGGAPNLDTWFPVAMAADIAGWLLTLAVACVTVRIGMMVYGLIRGGQS